MEEQCMLPLLNNKSLLDCNYEDFKDLMHNEVFRENQFLDYKENFSFLVLPKETKREIVESKIVEFRNDVCSFANADGGYIVYGIKDNCGMAEEITGIEISNRDKFELDLRNKLNHIMPKIPQMIFRFVEVDKDHYIVVIYIKHDDFAPYIHLEDQKNYKIYKRSGNGKTVINYTELKNMFIQSRVFEEQISLFREKRIIHYINEGLTESSSFMIFHIIPETYLNDRKQLFIIEKQSGISFKSVFSGTNIDSLSLPCVDGLHYVSLDKKDEAYIYNNGIVEYFLPLVNYIDLVNDDWLFFYNEDVWRYIDSVAQGYQSTLLDLFGEQRYFGCISIIGCKGVVTELNDIGRNQTRIDRDKVICHPIPFFDFEDKDLFYKDLKKLHLEFLLSIGIRKNHLINELIECITD